MTTQAIVPSNGNQLSDFGSRDTIKEMADRLRKMMPGTTRLEDNEALTVAQVAVAHGLDPFNGEVWGIKGDNGKWYGTMIGIKGLRKKAHEQADREGCTYWCEEPVLVPPEKYGAPANSVVYEIRLRDTATMQAYGKSINILTTSGVPYKEAVEMIGKAPVYLGVGIATADEHSKMKIHARARKRAESEAIKQRFDVEFRGVTYVEGDEDAPDVPTAEAAVVEGNFYEQQALILDSPEPRSELEILADMGLA